MSRQSIIKAWVDALRNASLDMTLQNEITELMRQLSDRDGTDYYCRLSKDPQCIGVCELIARTIASHCEGVKTEETLSCQFITNKCEDTVSLFSEAYADMQMLEVLGYDMFNLDDYCNTLEEIKEGGISGKVSNLNEEYIVAQHLLRYSVLKRQLTVNCESLTNVFQETEVRCVLNYLEQCKAIYNTEKTIATNVQDVLAPVFNKRINRKQWCESLCTVLKDYESRIRSMYKAEDNII